MSVSYDPNDPAVLRDPHALFALLRAADPVHWSRALSGWVVTSYEYATEVVTDGTHYSADRLVPFQKHVPEANRATAADILRWLQHWMVFRDPPDHTRLRRHLAQVLNPEVFESYRAHAASVVDFLLDQIPRGEDIDFHQKFSLLMPGIVVADLLGVSTDRVLEVKRWSDDMMLFIGSARGVPDKYARARSGAMAMAAHFQELIAERRKEPRGDALTKLMATEVEGQRLNDDELIGSMMMVLNGGHETTANLLNNSLLALLKNPAAMETLRNNPKLVPAAVEEFLRYDGPVLSVGRLVAQDTVLGERDLSKGERIFIMLVAANRDPDIFSDPDALIIDRSPNPHMAFSKGPHFCMGTQLARVEGQVALTALLSRYRSIELRESTQSIAWINSLVTRGPTRMPLRLS
jgi:cytochrome P450